MAARTQTLPRWCCAGLLVLSIAAYAQTQATDPVFVVSQPGEVKVRLRGAYDFSGHTPLTIPQRLAGVYTLTATAPGYERKRLQLYFDLNSARKITLGLAPLSRFKAARNSLLLPGSGQRYKGSHGRGLLFSGLCLSASLGAAVTHARYLTELKRVDRAEREYADVQNNFEPAQTAWRQWRNAQQEAEVAQRRRTRAFYVAAGLWAINVFDALLAPPSGGEVSELKTHQKISHSFKLEDHQLNWQVRF